MQNDTPKGQCASCGDFSPYSVTICSSCGSRLPWADAVSSRARTERKQGEEALRESETRYRTLAEVAPDDIFIVNRDGVMQYINHHAAQKFGVLPEALIGKSQTELFSPQQAEINRLDANQVFETGEPLYRERHLTFHNRDLWVGTWFVPLKNAEGEVVEMMGVARDISGQKEAEETLRASEARFRTAITEAPVPIMIHREDGTVLQISKGWTEYSGYDLEDVPTVQAWAERAYGAGSTKVHEYIKSLFEIENTRSEGEWTITAKNGEKRIWDFVATPLGTFGDNQRVIINTAFDITDRREAEKKIRFQAHLLDEVGQAVITTNRDGTVVYWNRYAESLYGWLAQEAIGRNITSVVVPEAAQAQAGEIMDKLNRGERWSGEFMVQRRDGTGFPAEVINTPIYDEAGAFCGIIGISQDITERKQAEQALQRSEQEQRELAERLEHERARLAEAQAVAKVGSWELDLITNVLTWSAETYRIFELDGEEFGASYAAFLELTHPDDRAAVDKAHRESVANRTPYEIDHRIQMKDGSIKVLHERCRPFYDDAGRPIRSAGTTQDITERKQAEERVLQSEANLARAQEIARLGSWELDLANLDDLKKNPLRWSDQVFRIFGYQPNQIEVSNENFFRAVHPDDREVIYQTITQAIQEQKPYKIDHRIVLPDGSERIVQEQGETVFDEHSGKPLKMVGTTQDITERKQAEVALRDSEERYRSLALATAQIVWTTPPDGAIEDMPAWRAFTGQSLEEVQGWGWTQAVHPSDRERTEKIWANCVETRSLYKTEYRIRAADGSYRLFAVRGVPILENDGSIREWVGTCTDIHDQRQAEEERDRFFTISLDMLAIIGSDGYFKRVNPAWEATLGFSDAEMMAVPFLEFVHPDDRAATIEEDAKLIRGGELMRFENRYRCRDGSYKWLLWMCASFEDLIYCVTHDVTEAKQTERAIRESEEYFRFLNDLSEATRPLADAEQIMAVTARMLGEHLGASRCAYADVEPGGDKFTILYDYTDGCASTVGKYQLSLFGPRAVATLESGKTLIIRDVDAELSPDAGAEMFNAIGIQAIITCPLVKEGVLRAMMAVHQTAPRDWQPSEITLVQDVVERCWATIERRTAEERILQLNAELEQRVMERTAELERANDALREEETEQQQIMATLSLSEERFRLLVESVHDYAILMMDTTGHIMTWNAGAERMKGYRAEEIIGQHFSCFYTEEDQQAGKPEQELKTAVTEGYLDDEGWRVRQDGSQFWATLVITALRDESGNLRGFAKVSRDITERKNIEAALHEAKAQADAANHAKSEFLSRMSHELRTPLNAILGFGQILDRQDLNPRSRESVGHILKGGRHLLGLINEVLDIARVEAGHLEISLEPVALDDVVPDACALVRPLVDERNIHLDIRLGENTFALGRSYVLADLQRLKQVLINLLSNAIKYNRENGQVEISCEQTRDGWISIAVRDTGPGISPQDLPKLFTPFERLSAATSGIEGTGLGLVLSQRLVIAMGGALKVQSTLGQGTTFILELPQATAPEEQVMNVLQDIDQAHPDKKIERTYSVLCIEDNPSNLRLMEAIFEGRPEITLLAAMQGSVGLDLARQHEPDLILLDLDLPDIHGSEVLIRLQRSGLTREIPVVVVSADATPKQIERLLRAGAKAYLTKPLDVGQFFHTVDKFLQVAPAIATTLQE